MSLWKPYRLREDRQFRKIIVEKGQKKIDSNFTIFFSANNYNNCRFGISIPQKLVKLATDRNFYKRQVKAMLISHLKSDLKKKPNSCQTSAEHYHFDLVILIRNSYLESNFLTNQERLYKLISLISFKKTNNIYDQRKKNPTISDN